jgi:hypothetical protein
MGEEYFPTSFRVFLIKGGLALLNFEGGRG